MITSGVLIALGLLLLVSAWLKYWADPNTTFAEQSRWALRIVAHLLFFVASSINLLESLPHWNIAAILGILFSSGAAMYCIVCFPEDTKGDRP